MLSRRFFLFLLSSLPFLKLQAADESQKIESDGEVLVNGKPLQKGGKIALGDEIETKGGSKIQFNINKDAFKLRENSKVIFGQDGAARVIKLISGGIVGVFEKGRTTIETKTVTMGIRGTGMYAEIFPDKLYVCNCYGLIDFKNDSSGFSKTTESEYHDDPQYFYEKNGQIVAEKTGMVNHRDEELEELEDMVGRDVPFRNHPRKLFGDYNY